MSCFRYYFISVNCHMISTDRHKVTNFLTAGVEPMSVPRILSEHYKSEVYPVFHNIIWWNEITEQNYERYKSDYIRIEPKSSESSICSESSQASDEYSILFPR